LPISATSFPRYATPEGETQMSFLCKRVDEGARRRYQPYHECAQRQLERELALIEKLKLAGYFLCVWDIVRFCKDNGILAQCRGSAANSAVCYALEIIRPVPIVGKMVHPYLEPAAGQGSAGLPAPVAGTGAAPHAGRAAIPGATAAHGHDRRRIYGRAGRGVAQRHGLQALGKARPRTMWSTETPRSCGAIPTRRSGYAWKPTPR
jgi:hypothetical protein